MRSSEFSIFRIIVSSKRSGGKKVSELNSDTFFPPGISAASIPAPPMLSTAEANSMPKFFKNIWQIAPTATLDAVSLALERSKTFLISSNPNFIEPAKSACPGLGVWILLSSGTDLKASILSRQFS